MKHFRLSLIAFTLMVSSLSLSDPFEFQRVSAQGSSQSTVPVYTTPDGFLLGDVVDGAEARLVRNPNGLTTNVHTFVSPAGAYTLWWVVFNHPQNCTTYLCTFDEPDFAIGATGHPTSDSAGTANFSGRLSVGGPYNNYVLYEGPDPGLTNPSGALITLVIRYHGPNLEPGGSNEFRGYFAGCADGGAPCQDQQLVVFPGDCSGLCLVPF